MISRKIQIQIQDTLWLSFSRFSEVTWRKIDSLREVRFFHKQKCKQARLPFYSKHLRAKEGMGIEVG